MKSTFFNFGRKSLLSLLVLVGLASGCAPGPKVHTQRGPGANYTHFHSFAVFPLATPSTTNDPDLVARVADSARRTTIETLASFGLREAIPQEADLLVTVRVQFTKKEKVTEWGYLAQPVSRVQLGSYRGGDRPRGKTVRIVEERTLTIEVVDNHTKQLTWTGELASSSSERLEAEQVQKAIRRVLSEFPVSFQIASIRR